MSLWCLGIELLDLEITQYSKTIRTCSAWHVLTRSSIECKKLPRIEFLKALGGVVSAQKRRYKTFQSDLQGPDCECIGAKPKLAAKKGPDCECIGKTQVASSAVLGVLPF